MSDGRKTRRNTKDKFSQDVSKINNILKQRAVDAVQAKKHGGEGKIDKQMLIINNSIGFFEKKLMILFSRWWRQQSKEKKSKA